MKTFSHSKLTCFEQCKYKYKLQYIDKVEVEIPTTIEAFMGDLVHRTLHKLYDDLRFQKLNSLKDLLKFFNDTWKKEWTDDILIVKDLTEDNYRMMGEKYIADYYKHYKPFDQMTILGLETQQKMPLGEFKYHVRIDKLACKGDIYYVCDYKTNSRMLDQEKADSDRQLAMYSIWVKDRFKDAKKVVLLWHMLAFDKEVESERTDEELTTLQEEAVELIKEVESCKEFPTNVTALCDYCVFKSICPSFKHQVELEEKSVQEFKDDDGVKLVDRYAQLKQEQRKIESEMNNIKKDLILFSKKKDIDHVYGSSKKINIKEYDRVIYPDDKEELIKILKDRGIYDSVSMIAYPRLNAKIVKKKVDEDILSIVEVKKDYRLIVGKRKDTEE